MTTELKSWWAEMTLGQKAARGAGVTLTFLLALGAKVQGWTEMPDRLTAVEGAIMRQDSSIQRLQRGEARAQYLFCVDLADRGLISKTAQDCYEDYNYPTSAP